MCARELMAELCVWGCLWVFVECPISQPVHKDKYKETKVRANVETIEIHIGFVLKRMIDSGTVMNEHCLF